VTAEKTKPTRQAREMHDASADSNRLASTSSALLATEARCRKPAGRRRTELDLDVF